MSRENVALVHAVIDAWNGGDLEDVAQHLADGIEWLEVEGRPEEPVGEAARGRERLQSGFAELFDSWQSYRLEPEEIRDVDEHRVVAILREVARGRASGAEIASRWGYVMTIRDGKVSRVEAYRDAQRALEAVS